VKAIWRNRVDVQAIGGPVADALDDIVSAINTQPIELSLPNGKTTRIHAGVGSPERVITGSPGDVWLRTDGTAALYLKATGINTTTGWQADGERGTWTPIDSSGAGLGITVTSAVWQRVGGWIQFTCQVGYPATASGANFTLGGLPATAAVNTGVAVGLSNATVIFDYVVLGGTTTISSRAPVSAAVGTNAQHTNAALILTGMYPV
jgi:hypothetical protein